MQRIFKQVVRRSSPLFALVVALLASQARGGATVETKALDRELSLDLGSFDGLEEQALSDELRGRGLERSWTARFKTSELDIEQWTLPDRDGKFHAPEDALDLIEWERQRETKADPIPFYFQERVQLSGRFGYAPYASVGLHSGEAGFDLLLLTGLLEGRAYAVEISCEPALATDDREELLARLGASIRYEGDAWDVDWTVAETEERWSDAFPARVQEQDELGVLRTEHFVVLTNMRAKGGTVKKFGKVMEKYYDEIEKVFPFEEVDGERLMPIYLFRTRDQFMDFLGERHGTSGYDAQRIRSIVHDDYYATYFESANDPDYKYGATQLVFVHRLRFSGGGAWFWAGLAEYMEKAPNDRKQFRNLAKSETAMPLEELFLRRQFVSTAETRGNEVEYLYRQCACVIEFARESKWAKKHFVQFMNAFGRAPAYNMAVVESALSSIYGVDLAEFEERFLDYWKRRR